LKSQPPGDDESSGGFMFVVPPLGGLRADRLKAELQTGRPAVTAANFLFFDGFPTMLLRSDFFRNDQAQNAVLD
jgi:hypothetical protein